MNLPPLSWFQLYFPHVEMCFRNPQSQLMVRAPGARQGKEALKAMRALAEAEAADAWDPFSCEVEPCIRMHR